MRIEIFGELNFVTSASVAMTESGVHLLVNLKERWAVVHVQGGSLHYIPSPGTEHWTHNTVVFYDPSIEDDDAREARYTELVLIAESDADNLLLRSTLRYQQQCKDQFCLLYVPTEHLRDKKQLATYASPQWAAFCASKD